MSTETARPKARNLKSGDFIAWSSHKGVQVHRVQRVHSNGHVLRDEYGHVDQFDSLPRRWRMATDAEIADYRGNPHTEVDDSGPCCIAYVTPAGRDHIPGCG